ncbi:response regulator [Aquisalimonas sp.]|uniref:response regulator n=1 Tax=Aquisalimonas sp. TaxID=1872621 RepID=UPI0025B7F4A2|nr:response regulator [Aquisalimonas sp.]
MLVDDEALVLRSLVRSLRRMDECICEMYTSAPEALNRMRTKTFDVVVSDYRMPEMSGVEFLGAARELQPRAVRMILSGHADLHALVGAINDARIFQFLEKPWEESRLMAALSRAFEERDRLLEEGVYAGMYRIEKGL